jgi:uncharacterized protein (DUF427 family)
VELDGVTVAETTGGYRVLETSHPPTYYFPPDDVLDGCLERTQGSSYSEWKGMAHSFDVTVGDRVARDAAWGYHTPNRAFVRIAGFVAFSPALMDRCLIDDEVVEPQSGERYGGWISSDLVGPFKGDPGTRDW